jgi:hypothetical protein
VTPRTRTGLDDERAFLLQSIEDLDREHAAGDLSDDDYRALRDAYTARAAVLLAGEQRAAGDGGGHHTAADADVAGAGPHRRRRRRRRGLLVAGLTALVSAAVAVAVISITRPRGPDQTATGSVTQAPSQQVREELAQAESLDSAGDVATAMELYQAVLQVDPNQPEALAESGWIEFESGVFGHSASVVSRGQRTEERAAALAPAAWAPRLYLGSMYLTEGDPGAAVRQFRRFVADHPPRAKLAAARPVMVKAFGAVHQPLPAAASSGA